MFFLHVYIIEKFLLYMLFIFINKEYIYKYLNPIICSKKTLKKIIYG